MENIVTKKCARCKTKKDIKQFYKINGYCKECVRDLSRIWISNNKDKRRETAKLWRKNNPDKVKKSAKKTRERNIENVKKSSKIYYQNNKEEIANKNRERYQSNKQKMLANGKARHQKIREQVINSYGGCCACCGESTYEFLAIDHVNNDGAKMRRERLHPVGSGFYTWLRDNNYPIDFQVLCHNCNSAKGLYGTCPHKRVL